MVDHTLEGKDAASSAGNAAAANRTGARGAEESASGCSTHAEKKATTRTGVLVGHDDVRGLSSHGGNTAAARRTGARGGEPSASRCSSYAEEEATRRTGVLGGHDGVRGLSSHAGNTAAARRNGAHGAEDSSSACCSHAEEEAAARTEVEVFRGDDGVSGMSSHAGNKAARRTLAYRDEESFRHAAASGALPRRRRARADTIPGPGAKKLKEADGGGISASAGSSDQVRQGQVATLGSARAAPRLIDVFDIGRINKTALAAVGGHEMPAFLRIAAQNEAIKAAAPRKEAMARSLRKTGGLPARAPVQRRQQPQLQTDPEPHTQPQLQLPRRPLPDQSCPRCHMNSGTVAPHHLCRCSRCTKSTEECPFCYLAALRKIDHTRGMCPSCGERAGKLVRDHVCTCDICSDCPRCDLAKLPRPLPRRDGACPCCLEDEGNASSHLCLCDKCRLVHGSACPYCTLAEVPSPISPFDVIRLKAYFLK